MTEGERLQRAGQAQREITLTESLFSDMEAAAIAKWRSTGLDHTATRERLFLVVQTIDTVRNALRKAAEDGKVVQHGREMSELLRPDPQDRP